MVGSRTVCFGLEYDEERDSKGIASTLSKNEMLVVLGDTASALATRPRMRTGDLMVG